MTKPSAPANADSSDQLAASLRAVVSRLKRNLRAQSNHGNLTATQTAVLLRLEREGPGSVSELARAEGIRTQSMGTALAPLDEAGFIAGTPDPDDGRRTILSLTEAGKSFIDEGRSARQDWLAGIIRARLSSAEQAQLLAATALLTRLIDE
jgi:DNA-binding MarR family transcriptional regulator